MNLPGIWSFCILNNILFQINSKTWIKFDINQWLFHRHEHSQGVFAAVNWNYYVIHCLAWQMRYEITCFRHKSNLNCLCNFCECNCFGVPQDLFLTSFYLTLSLFSWCTYVISIYNDDFKNRLHHMFTLVLNEKIALIWDWFNVNDDFY